MKAWYFAPPDNKLAYGDGRAIEVGKMHTIKDKPKLCNVGLHGSVNLLDALQYANSSHLYRVDITRSLDIGNDKVCGKRREYLAYINAEGILREFARKQALINIAKIEPYCSKKGFAVIMQWLTTGDVQYRDAAAWSAAWYAAGSAAWSAAEYAAESAARSAARSNAGSAAWSAAWYAAESAARSAARSNARSNARSAAESAANDMLTAMIEGRIL